MPTRRRDAKPPQPAAGEKETLVGFLDHLREAVARKAEDAPEPDARAPGVRSGTSVLGLVHHLTAVESVHFLGARVTEWAATMRVPSDRSRDEIVAAYRAVVRRADEVIARYDDLSAPAPTRAGQSGSPAMRWLLVHMIEETGRHAGHVDILREQIDGSTGR